MRRGLAAGLSLTLSTGLSFSAREVYEDRIEPSFRAIIENDRGKILACYELLDEREGNFTMVPRVCADFKYDFEQSPAESIPLTNDDKTWAYTAPTKDEFIVENMRGINDRMNDLKLLKKLGTTTINILTFPFFYTWFRGPHYRLRRRSINKAVTRI